MSCQLEPAIWSGDTGQRISCFDRSQLTITWMSNTKEVHSKPRLHVSLSTCYLEYGSHLARLHRRRRRRRRRAYAPTSNTASHDNHSPLQKREGTGASFFYWLDWKSKHQNWNVSEWKATRPSLQRLSFTGALQRFFSHFKNYVLVDVNQMYPWQ